VLNFTLTAMALISSAVILYMLLYISLFAFSFIGTLVLYLSALIFIITDVVLIIDFFIYKLFHFHINGMVMNILTSPDAADSIQAGITPLISLVTVIISLILFEIYAIKKISSLNKKYKISLNSRINKIITIPLILIIFSEKISYGVAVLFSKNEITRTFKVIPIYQKVTFNKIASKYFGFKAEAQARYSIKTEADLNYPLKPIELTKGGKKFNIYIIASDAVKYSIIDEKLAPNITSFSKNALNFTNHYSGGNSTRFGIFSLIYGLNPTYWFSFLNANQGAIIFDILQKLNYEINIISSTSTNWPEFRKTCYVNIQNSIKDDFKGVPWEKDKQSTDYFLSKLDKQNKNKPTFSFIFLDSPHGYSYSATSNKYNASDGEINYLNVSENNKELIATIKRYKNAVSYNDTLFGKMIKKLKDRGLYDNALIIYTSDHGQEFFEQGNFGHNTAFSKGQIHIPFILKLPKFLQKSNLGANINSTITSHQDVVPSLLTLLGVKNNPQEYSNGANFFSSTFKRDYIFSSNWNNNAIVSAKSVSVFSNLPNKIFNNEVRDPNSYKLLPKEKTNSKFVLDTINENKKFLK
jgi:membrane-anchored protein YejM (alkaline phosphatase superfamily)